MTKEEAILKLRRCQGSEEIEEAHQDADGVLCDLLDSLGYEDVVREFNKVERHYFPMP